MNWPGVCIGPVALNDAGMGNKWVQYRLLLTIFPWQKGELFVVKYI